MYMYVYICIYTYICLHIYVCVYMYTHTPDGVGGRKSTIAVTAFCVQSERNVCCGPTGILVTCAGCCTAGHSYRWEKTKHTKTHITLRSASACISCLRTSSMTSGSQLPSSPCSCFIGMILSYSMLRSIPST